MIMVEGWVRLAPGEITRLRDAAIIMRQATLQEPGCLAYAFSVDIEDAQCLRISERWQDQAALEAHFATPHMAQFNAALAGAGIEGASIHVYAGEYVRAILQS